MKRREFLGIAAAGAAGLACPTFARADEAQAMILAQPRLLRILRDERAVLEIGQRYLETTPAENDPRTLTQLLLASSGPATSTAHAAPAELRLRLDERVQRDFAEGRTVTLRGWILAVTEARQSALFSLLPA